MPYKTNIEVTHNSCQECGKEVYGRSDKKFCNDSCRNNFHNRRTNERKRIQNSVLRTLQHNYEILERFLEIGLTSISSERLSEAGYIKENVTGYRKTATGHDECMCFDIRYCQTGKKIFKLERFSPTDPLEAELPHYVKELKQIPSSYGTRR